MTQNIFHRCSNVLSRCRGFALKCQNGFSPQYVKCRSKYRGFALKCQNGFSPQYIKCRFTNSCNADNDKTPLVMLSCDESESRTGNCDGHDSESENVSKRKIKYPCGNAPQKSRAENVWTSSHAISSLEALVGTMVMQDVKHVFGTYSPGLQDLFGLLGQAGIQFVCTVHEQGAVHMADGYSRISGKHGVCIAQNGPCITNFVTGLAAAYWAHSPVVAITPEVSTMTKGLGHYQEVDQLPIFQSVTKFQGHVNHPSRMAEIASRCFDVARSERGPTQLNVPVDFFLYEGEFAIPQPVHIEKSAGGPSSLSNATNLIQAAKNPVILAGGGVVMGNAVQELTALAEYLQAPVCTTYLHNDAFPSTHKLWCGPLGNWGHLAAMRIIHDADLVLAIGTRSRLIFGRLNMEAMIFGNYGDFPYNLYKNKLREPMGLILTESRT